MPSSSPAPKAEPGTTSSVASSSAGSEEEPTTTSLPIKNQLLHIDSTKPADELERQIIDIHGAVAERPYYRYTADQYPDARDRLPYTLQFSCEEQDGLFIDAKRQDNIRQGLWAALKELDDLDGQPKITVSERHDAHGQASGQIINLTFGSTNALLPVHNAIKEIVVEGPDGRKCSYSGELLPSALAGDVFIFDCLNFPVDSIEVKPLFNALAHMTEDFGTLVGMAKIVIKEKGTAFESELDTLRCYLQLGRAWVAAPLAELAARFPSHFVWMGRPYKLLFTGYDLRDKPLRSADYPLEGALPAAAPSPSQPSTRKRKSQG